MRIGRHDRDAEGFAELEIQLASRCIRILRKGKFRDDDLAERMLLLHVPPDRVLLYEMYGEPTSTREAEFRIAKWRAKLKPIRIFDWINLLVLVPACICLVLEKANGFRALWNLPGLALGWRIVGSIVFAFTFGVPPFLVWLMTAHIRKTFMKQITELQEWLQSRASRSDD